MTEVLQSIGETSTSTYPSVKPSDIGNLVIDMPPLDEQHLIANGHVLEYVFDELPSTGQTRAKKLLDVLRTLMPSFEYFKADSSLSDSDTSVQKYFKDKAFDLLKTQIDTTDVEQKIRKELETPLSTITKKIFLH